jgi:acetoin utilization deacetylase AcuC-like enzyme
MEVSTGLYGWMTERAIELADRHAGGRLLSLLEGGYSLEALPRCVAIHLEKLRGS